MVKRDEEEEDEGEMNGKIRMGQETCQKIGWGRVRQKEAG